MSKPIAIIKSGYTHHNLSLEKGDFDDWTFKTLDIPAEKVLFVDAFNNELLPKPDQLAGAVITGAHSMVTDREEWSKKVEIWVKEMHKKQIPLLGICYGHQLIAQALQGTVENNIRGKELGTVAIDLTQTAKKDYLFKELPDEILVNTCHSQTVTTLPEGAVILAENEFDPHHAVRTGKNTWGIQFHPEFDCAVMREYIQRDEDYDRFAHVTMTEKIQATPLAKSILVRFAKYCFTREV